MNQPREFFEAVTGEQLFGSRLTDVDLSQFEIYSPEEANVIELFRWGQRLVDGGPPVDLKVLQRLKSERNVNVIAAEQLKTLMQYASWFRTHHALVLASRNRAANAGPDGG